MFKERLQSCKHQRESFGRIYRLSYNLVLVSGKTGVGNTHKSCAVWSSVKTHSTVVGAPSAGHSMRIRAFLSMVFTFTCRDKSYISQSHLTCLPGSSLPLALVNQNLDVMAGLTKASNNFRNRSANEHFGLCKWLMLDPPNALEFLIVAHTLASKC